MPPPVRRPDTPRPVLLATRGLFGALARLRADRRSMHGPGDAYAARVVIDPPPGLLRGAPLFERPGRYDAVARFSRGIGLPQPLPDLLGIAVRLHDAHGPGVHQDLLVTSSGGRPGLRRMLIPARDGWFGQWYSSVLPFRIGDRRTLLGLRATGPGTAAGRAAVTVAGGATRPGGELRFGTDRERLRGAVDAGGATFALALADGPGWTRVGTVHVDAPLGAEASAALSFDPWTTGPGVRPAGLLNRLRSAAYPGSRGAREAP